MKKILFVDTPFADTTEHDKRSSFIWSTLCSNFDADLLLIKTQEYLTKNLPEHKGYEQLHTLATARTSPFQPPDVFQFSQDNLDKFTQILVTKRYEFIFFRRLHCFRLLLTAEKALPDCRLYLDVDALLSDAALAEWQRDPSLKNRKAQFDYMTLKNLEKQVFRKNIHFFFAGKGLLRRTMKNYGIIGESSNLTVLPNALPPAEIVTAVPPVDDKQKALLADKFILFYGNLGSPENIDAFLHLAKDIYPRISKKLQEKDIKIYIMGDNPQRLHETYSGGRIKLIGPVENLQAYIRASLFVVLPMKHPLAEAGRIMEAALLQKAILTTSRAIADLDISGEDMAIEDSLESFCERLVQLLQKPGETIDLGKLLYNKVTALYDRGNIEKQLLLSLEGTGIGGKTAKASANLRIAIVTNNFYPETDKLSCHVLTMAKKLAETNEVTVFCPRRTYDAKRETIDNVTVYRLFDIMNYPVQFPNQKTKTLCPELFFQLMKHDFNLIQYYPGFDSNYVLTFLASKIKEIPIILNVINFQNFEQIVRESGTATQDIINKIEIGWLEKVILKNTDYLFTVTEKEYSYFRKLHERVEHIPLPWMCCEPHAELPSMREKYGIPADAFIFLCVGKIAFLKGQDLALKAFIKALPDLPGARLVFIGRTDLEPDFFEDMEAVISREALQEEILFKGKVERDEALAWLQESDIHVIPARFMHIGNVVIDSWTTGTPVLQSDAVDPNLVIDNYNGYLFCSEDVDDLAQQMQRAYVNKQALEGLGEHGKALVNDKYSFDYLLKRYLLVYKQLTL
jgi:glycosyltransferase involved in cell wall biosynthesis